MSSKTIKILGIVATVAGAALTVLNSYVDDKKQDDKIQEGISKAFEEYLNSNKEEA